MAVNLSPVGGVAAQFFTSTGAVLTGGKLYTYAAGTTTPATTFTSANGATPWANPIVLDAAGRVPGSGEIWLTDGISYKFVLKDSNDVLIATYDNITGINSNFVNFVNQQEIVTATAGQTVFNLGISYQPATNSLSVFVDGVNQYGPGAQYSYVETDDNTVTFNSGLHVGAEVKFTTSQLQGGAAVDASQVSYQPPFTSSVATNVELKLAQTISIVDFGAVGDFNSSTGVGTDNRLFIQAALDYACTVAGGCTVIFPAGNYYLGTSNTVSDYQLMLGSITTPNTANNVRLSGTGATLFGGSIGEVLGVYNANNCTIEGLKIICYTGGPLSQPREFNHAIDVRASTFITIQNNYLTNFLGDGIFIGGAALYCQHVRIMNNTIKERYGNGVRSYNGGSQSRLCIAVTNAYDVLIEGNTILGGVDWENDTADQYLKVLTCANNMFVSGNVTPQAVIGTAYWYDEPINIVGGTEIIQSIQFSGITGFTSTTQSSPALLIGNYFENATVFFNSVYYRVHCKQNHFNKGLITCGSTSGANDNNGYVIEGNTCAAPYGAETCFIKLGGDMYTCNISNNTANIPNGYVIGAAVGGVDKFGNVFANNINFGNPSLGVHSFAVNPKSVYANNYSFANVDVQFPITNSLRTNKSTTGAFQTVSVGTASAAITYASLTSDTIVLNQTGLGTLGSITGAPDGAEITIKFGAPAVQVINSTNIRLKGGVDIVAPDANANVTLIAISGIFLEKCRSF